MLKTPSHRQLNLFLGLTGLALALHVFSFASRDQFGSLAVLLWTCATTLSYTFIYLLPSALLVQLGGWLLPRSKRGRLQLAAVAILTTGLTHIALYADHVIYGMYGFHINGFVIDLATTPGGMDSLGASLGTQLTAVAVALGFLCLQAMLYMASLRQGSSNRRPVMYLRWLLPALMAMGISERVAYGYSAVIHYQPILVASEHYPLYLPLTFRKLASRLGIGTHDEAVAQVQMAEGQLNYPLRPLQVEPPARPLNVVWLVAESLRYDMLDRKIMPQLWNFSEQALRLENHFSGGNLTQMGVFSMFYGLYGNYWFPMQATQRPPVLMEVLKQQGYQFSLHTSQRFTYPAFDKTVFANMAAKDMHALPGGAPPWQRDETNISDMLGFIDHRDTTRPFMTYMFFESTHANYDFPPATAIAKPYVEDFNYLTTDIKAQIGGIKNRYINAAHHVDSMIGKVVDHLRRENLLDNTIVIVLGDHGEEFMERKRWGHSAEFNRFQTGTPAVIHIPGQKPGVMTGITSHLDIPATLLPLLGVKNSPADYSMGQNLLSPDYHRDYAVAADWNRIAYIGSDFKVTFPVNATGGAAHNEVTDSNDWPVNDPAGAKQRIQSTMVEMMRNLTRFGRARG